ncbi:hypothetical protein AAG570_005358 [Ranatra chinensis]|uniref:Sodium/calcium exchanger membrane region domain-containing protein n=1 Tax=Ranatra chinensis TaxID=642074 RepID=A0ABD0Y076_9HEMI
MYALAFFMCLAWTALISYVVAWMITIAGYTLNIPDSLMGLTFIAIGMNVPEVASSVIVASQGHGTMALSNSLGSNTFDILICLGLPWLVKAAYFPSVEEGHYVEINSRGLGYSSYLLLATLLLLYTTLACNKFTINRTVSLSQWRTSINGALFNLYHFYIEPGSYINKHNFFHKAL